MAKSDKQEAREELGVQPEAGKEAQPGPVAQQKKKTPLVVKESYSNFPVVDHKPARCPNCTSVNNSIVKTEHPSPLTVLRTHHCEKCKAVFKSVQTLSPIDFPNGKPLDGAATA